MFENPLRKYAAGGVTSAQEQKLVQIFSKAASKLNIKPEVLIQKVQELSGEQQVGFVQAIQDIADNENPKPESIQLIQSIFAQPAQSSQYFKKGGKIHDFICKHAKGGALKGCGCKQEGGSIWGNPYTDSLGSWRNFHFPEGGFAGTVDMNTGRAYKAETNEEMLQPGRYNRKGYPMPGNASTNGTWYEVNPYGSILVNIPEGGQQVLHGNDSIAVANLIKQWDQSKVGHAITEKENGGTVEKVQDGKKINNKRKTITEVGDGLSKYDAEEMGIDPNTIVPTGSIITAYPNTKPYIVNGQVPFNKRNGLVFNLGGIESREVEDGSVLGGIPGRKYKISSITPQENYHPTSSNYDAMNYPFIMRYASPKDTIYNLGFETYNQNSPAYPGIRLMYNSAIDLPNTMAGDEKSHRELQRQRQERAPKKEAQGGEIKKELANIEKAQNGESKLGDSKKEKDRQIVKQNLEKAKKTSDAIKESHKTSDSGWKYNWARERILNGRNGKLVNGTIQEIYHTGVNGVHGTLDTREGDSLLTGYPVLRTIGKQDVMNGEPGWDLARDKWFEILRSNRTTPYAESMQNNLDRERINHPKPKKDEQGGQVEKAQWGGVTTGNERTNSNNRGQYWEDLTINPEFGRTYRLTLPGGLVDSKLVRHYNPNGSNIIKKMNNLPDAKWVRWTNIYTPNTKDYSWNDFYFNHMKKNTPQRLSNAQRLVPPMYDVEK